VHHRSMTETLPPAGRDQLDEGKPHTGRWHRREAELLLLSEGCEYGCPHSGCEHELAHLARAQVHATLTLVDAVYAVADRG